jgi:hypothetical protein
MTPVVESTKCPYDGSPIEPEAGWQGPARFCCSVCGAAWELHRTWLRRVREPDRGAVLRARARREPVQVVSAVPVSSDRPGIDNRGSRGAEICAVAVCPRCRREVVGSESCRDVQLSVGGTVFAMIRYGDEDWFAQRAPVGRCHGCGVLPGGLHHYGCTMARCPRCRGQLASCECRFDGTDIAL